MFFKVGDAPFRSVDPKEGNLLLPGINLRTTVYAALSHDHMAMDKLVFGLVAAMSRHVFNLHSCLAAPGKLVQCRWNLASSLNSIFGCSE